jgi:hypothetical protein
MQICNRLRILTKFFRNTEGKGVLGRYRAWCEGLLMTVPDETLTESIQWINLLKSSGFFTYHEV